MAIFKNFAILSENWCADSSSSGQQGVKHSCPSKELKHFSRDTVPKDVDGARCRGLFQHTALSVDQLLIKTLEDPVPTLYTDWPLVSSVYRKRGFVQERSKGRRFKCYLALLG